ncbi:MAG: FixH family protein [Pseudomonadota bacterium]
MIHAELAPDPEATDKPLKGWHVLLIMLVFFGVMFSVNGVFLYHAITSFPGEDVKKSYFQGLNYNETLAARARQADLGWHAEAGLQGDEILLRLSDKADEPLTDRAVVGELRRVATRDQDQALVFQPKRGGAYSAPAGTLSPGQWRLRVSVLDAKAEKVVFQVEKTLIVS